MADIGTAYVRIAPNMTGIQGKIAAGFRGTGNQVANQFSSELSAKSAAIAGAVAGVAAAAVNKAMNLLGNSIGDAISRVDTLARFPTVMRNLGYSAEGASVQVSRIAKELIGLPTSLDSLVTFVQRVAPVSKSLEEATDLALAFNNAVLAGGGPTYRQADAIEQFTQMLAKGKPDMMAWRTLQEAMPATLGQIAKQLGITSGNTLDLYDALMNGTLGFDDFTGAVMKLNSEGLPGFKNFEAQAKDATAGIATGMQNAQTAITRGLAKIMQTIGQKNISNAIGEIGKAFENGLNLVARAVPPVLKSLGQMADFVTRNKDVITSLAVGIGAAVVAIKAYNAVMAVSRGITAAHAAVTTYLTLVNSLQAQGLGTLRAAWFALNTVMRANPIGIIITAVTALAAGLVYFFNRTEKGKQVFEQLRKVAMNAWSSIQSGLQTASDFFNTVWGHAVRITNELKDAFDTAYGAVKNFISAGINVLNSAMQATLKWLYDWRQWFINIGIIIGTVVAPLLVKLGAQAVAAGAQWVASMVRAGASSAAAGARSALAFAQMAISATINAAKSAAAWSVAAVKTSIAWLKALPGMLLGFAQAALAATINAAKVTLAWVTSAGSTLLAWGRTFAMYALGVATAAAQTLIAGARMAAGWLLALGPIGLVIAVVAGAVALIIANWNKLGPFFMGLWNGIKNVVAGVINWIKSNWQLLLAIITGPIGLAVYVVSRNLGSIKAAFSSAFHFVTGLWGRLSGFFSGIFNNIRNAFSSIPEVGRNIVQGLWNGISGMGGWLKDKIIGFVKDKIPGPVRKALGISSPSKVAAALGKEVPRGLAQGIEKASGVVAKAADNMANKAIVGMTSPRVNPAIAFAGVTGAAGAGNGAGNTTSQTVTIQNINLGDASAVRQFFKELNQDTINVGMGLTPLQGAQ